MIRSAMLLLLLSGCSAPPAAEGARSAEWRPTGANEMNLRLMAADPAELRRGTGSPGAEGHGAAEAVARLREGRVRPLPDSAASRVTAGGAAGGAP